MDGLNNKYSTSAQKQLFYTFQIFSFAVCLSRFDGDFLIFEALRSEAERIAVNQIEFRLLTKRLRVQCLSKEMRKLDVDIHEQNFKRLKAACDSLFVFNSEQRHGNKLLTD